MLTDLFASTLIKQNESVAILTGISVYVMSKHLCWQQPSQEHESGEDSGKYVGACLCIVGFLGKKIKPINFTRRLIKNSLCSSSLSFLSEVIDQNYIIALILALESTTIWIEGGLFLFSVKSWLCFSPGETTLMRRNMNPCKAGL